MVILRYNLLSSQYVLTTACCSFRKQLDENKNMVYKRL